MRSLTFAIEGEIDVQITVTELEDGSLRFDVELLGDGLTGDLRALYFDFGDETLLGGLSISGTEDHDHVTASRFAEDAVSYVEGRDTNVNGEVIKDYDKFDAGVEFGTAGTGSDDIQSTSFVLSHADGLTLDLISQMTFGARITSVGEEDGDRNGGLKLGGVSTAAPDALDDDLVANEDVVLNGNVLADNGNGADGDADGDTLTVVAVNGNEALVGSAVAASSTGGRDGLLSIDATGNLVFDANGQFEDLGSGETDTVVATYAVHDDNGGYDTATVTITIDGVNDAPEASADTIAGIVEAGGTDDAGTPTVAAIDVLDNDTDIDNPHSDLVVVAARHADAADIEAVGETATAMDGTYGTLFIQADGTTTYELDNDDPDTQALSGVDLVQDEFVYTVSDGELTDTATVSVEITGAEDASGTALLEYSWPETYSFGILFLGSFVYSILFYMENTGDGPATDIQWTFVDDVNDVFNIREFATEGDWVFPLSELGAGETDDFWLEFRPAEASDTTVLTHHGFPGDEYTGTFEISYFDGQSTVTDAISLVGIAI